MLNFRTKVVIGTIVNFIRLVSLVFEPYMPSTSAKINYLLGVEKDERNPVLGKYLNEKMKNQGEFDRYLLSLTKVSTGLKRPIALFQEYSDEDMREWREKFAGKQK